MTLARAINAVVYGKGVKPTNSISDARWAAMLNFITRNNLV